MRLCRDRAGRVIIDQQQRLPGRGAYVCPTLECAQLLMKKRALPYGFRAQVAEGDYSSVLEYIRKNASTRIDQSARPGEAGTQNRDRA
ncbi:MAG: YlxR family protein [bacterium]